MKLGEILIQLGMLDPERLRIALEERDLLGGRIGTQLVERGFVTTEQVSEALSRQMRVPAALQRHFDRADPSIVSVLKPNLAARYMAIPLVAARSGPKRIVVAMATPQDVLLVDDVSFALGARVEPMVAAELAIARNLKYLYNIEVKLARPAVPEAAALAGKYATAQETRDLSGELRVGLPMPVQMDPATVSTLSAPPSAAVDLEDAVHRLSVAEHREQIADILIDFMLPRFGCGMVMLIRNETVQVWRGFAPGVDSRAIETISFPATRPSMFRLARERRATFRGAPPKEGLSLHMQIWRYLQCSAPPDVVVVPVAIGERIICLVYAHGVNLRPMPDPYVHELQAMCNAVGSSFIRLIQAAKQGNEPPTLLPR